jgi:hypothetical protein
MPTNLLVLPLLGGFCFVHILYYLRFRAQRLEGYRLLIECAITGAGLLAISRLLIAVVDYAPAPIWLFSYRLRTFWCSFWPLEDAGTATIALFLGIFLPCIANCFYGKERAKDRALRRHSNALFRLLHDAASNQRPIAVTLANNKWYAGMVTDSPSLDPQEAHFRLLPILSGFRRAENLKVEVTVYYKFSDDARLKASDMAVTLVLEDVKIANLFDEAIFFDVFKHERQVDDMDTVTVEPKPDDNIPESYIG